MHCIYIQCIIYGNNNTMSVIILCAVYIMVIIVLRGNTISTFQLGWINTYFGGYIFNVQWQQLASTDRVAPTFSLVRQQGLGTQKVAYTRNKALGYR